MSREQDRNVQQNDTDDDKRFVSFIRRNNPHFTDVEIERLRQDYESFENGDEIPNPFEHPDYHRLTAYRRVPGAVRGKRQT